MAEEQVQKTTDAVSGATSGASSLIAGVKKDAADTKDDVKTKAGMLVILKKLSALL